MFKYLLASIVLIMLSYSAFSQEKQLTENYQFEKPTKSQQEIINNDIRFVVSNAQCYGSKKDKTITLTFYIHHGIEDKLVGIFKDNTMAFDNEGNSYIVKEAYFNEKSKDFYHLIPSKTLTKGSVVFKNSNPKIDAIKYISVYFKQKNAGNGKDFSEWNVGIYNQPIEWID